MALTKVTSNGITDSAVNTDKIANCGVGNADLGANAVTSAKINDGTITAADLNATLDLSSKTVTLPPSATAVVDQNIALLGFKMAVNDGLTVFNLVDGVVDEFHDESGTDEGEGSNDLYCSSNDNYINQTSPVAISAGFSVTASFDTNNLTIGRNSQKINGNAADLTVATESAGFSLVYYNATYGWRYTEA